MSKRKTLFATALAAAVGLSALVSIPESAIANDKKPVKDNGIPREIKTRELMAEREGLKLKLYEKWRVGNEDNWKQNGKVILLVHGATWASRCTFDPDPDHGYSMMEMLADAGYDVFAVDLHGYGRSERSDIDWTDAQSAAKDVEAAVEFIRALRWVERVHLFGYQWGAQPAALFASQKPHKVGRLAVLGMRYRLTDKAGNVPPGPLRTLGQQASLLKPEDGDLDPEFVRRRAQLCRGESASAPNGALLDLTKPSPVDPAKIKVPTLVLQGERDGSMEVVADRMQFFQQLGSPGKWFTFLPGVGKYAPIERTRSKFDQTLLSFLDQTP
ncbi:MAG TPA: alpha/beta fold hydrolase [Pseudomonadota bacterium]|jgi:pimeloyl-ACP methyl ester carboxylesterase|nr:alpha/beta fold hydrolase [Pseudomonadota bacterium]HND09045.1 alpha/beta fold hydrolase [Pseudomonadota bacterium]HNF95842.1 alpha/beta fold hydrolase [Pseudomonadota bacterium]HNI61062.1 alpha/beta fold hydrolase [Pseudomonadota bacterium]HNK46612.1 alpha/beta fold hydrolase [Pseudomonadota bacterium]